MAASMSEERIAPVRKTVTVGRSVEDAFRIFTEQIGDWWPMETHSVGESLRRTCAFERRPGGRLYQRHDDGTEIVWGEVLQKDPPILLAFTGHPG